MEIPPTIKANTLECFGATLFFFAMFVAQFKQLAVSAVNKFAQFVVMKHGTCHFSKTQLHVLLNILHF